MKAAALVLALSILSTGCVSSFMDDDVEGDDNTPSTGLEGPYKVFLAARGEAGGPVVATVDAVKVVTPEGVRSLTASNDPVDLSELSSTGQAVLVAAGTISGTVTRHEIDFVDVTEGGTPVAAQATWSVPFNFSVTGDVETTLTIDLGTSISNGSFVPQSDSVVVENPNGVVAQASRSQLRGDDRPAKVIEPLSTPEVRVEGAGGSFPSWEVGTDLNFSAVLPADELDRVSDAFWFFDDGNTKQGLDVQHAFRQPGIHSVSVIVQGTEGQQAEAETQVEAWYTVEGGGEGLHGVGGQILEEGRTHHNKAVDLDATNLTMSTIRVVLNASGASAPDTDDPSNVYVYLLDPDGNEIASSETEEKPKELVADGGNYAPGTYTLRVVAQTGISIGYEYTVEARFL